MKKFVLLLIVFLGTVGASAINVPKLKTIPEYEIKSEVINFDYSKMAYPYSDVKIGGNYSITDSITAPKKLVPGKDDNTRDIELDSFFNGFLFAFGFFMLCVLITLIMLLFGTFLQKSKIQ